MEKQPILALELLGAVLKIGRGGLWDSDVRPGARRVLSELSNHCHILIHTVLVSDDNQLIPPEEQATHLEQYLRAMGIPFDWVWCRPGKPQADFYAESFDDLQRFHETIMSGLPPGAASGSVQPEYGGLPGMPEDANAAGRTAEASQVQTSVATRKGTAR